MKLIHLFSLFIVIVLSTDYSHAQTWRGQPVKTAVKYDYAGPYYNGRAKVKLDKKWGFIDTLGQVIVKPKYSAVENFADNGLAKVRLGRLWGLINLKGEEVLKPAFSFISDFTDGVAVVRVGKEEAYIDERGNKIKKK